MLGHGMPCPLGLKSNPMLTTSDTARYAAMMALDLNDDELAAMTDYLNDMEDFISVLDNVNTEGLETMYSPLEAEDLRLRDDVAQRFPNVDAIMQNAPEVRDGFIVVKRVVGK